MLVCKYKQATVRACWFSVTELVWLPCPSTRRLKVFLPQCLWLAVP